MTPMHDFLSPIPLSSIPTGSVFAAPKVEGCSAVFAPCLDENCQRPCGARRSIPLIQIVDPPVIKGANAVIITAIIIIAILGVVGGAGALDHEAGQYQKAEN